MKHHHSPVSKDGSNDDIQEFVPETPMEPSIHDQQLDHTEHSLFGFDNDDIERNASKPQEQLRVPDSCPSAISFLELNEFGDQRYDECGLSLTGSSMHDVFTDGEEMHQTSTMAAVDRIEQLHSSGGALSNLSTHPFDDHQNSGRSMPLTSRTVNENISVDAIAGKDFSAFTPFSSTNANETPPPPQLHPEADAMNCTVPEVKLQEYIPFDVTSLSNISSEHRARTIQNFHLITEELDRINAEIQYIFSELLTRQYERTEETLNSGHESIILQEAAQECMQDQIMSFVDAVKNAFQILDVSKYN
ncbi:hypothetical protein BGX27_001611 [Mortierella sp. AM989]|nr:hypothetical protein BGX27_001611 [Mortierella sp. AM989]